MKIIDSGMPVEEMWKDFFNPEAVLTKMGVTRDMRVIVDLGCGYGTFTIPAANMFPESIVYGIDIEQEMIDTLATKAKEKNLSNIRPVMRDFVESGSGLVDQSADFVMLFNILHAEKPVDILSEARRILKKSGKAGIMHWIYDNSTPRGPSLDIRPRPEQCREWAKQAGFSIIENEFPLKPYHYGIMLGG